MSLFLAILAATADPAWMPPPGWPDNLTAPCEITMPAPDPDQFTIAGIGFSADDVESVESDFDFANYPVLSIVFTESGTRKFHDLQTGRLGQPMPICIGNEILATPVLNEIIGGDAMQISGVYSVEESKALAGRIKAALRTRPVGR